MVAGKRSMDDPLTLAMRPPPNETPEEKATRLAEEEAARQTSAKIDEQLRAERALIRKESRNVHKVLLLGMSI